MRPISIGILFLACGVLSVSAATISVEGNLETDCTHGCAGNTSDGDYAQYGAAVHLFNIPTPSTVYAVTFSYGGGTNGSGATILNGGFQPYLSLFDNAGTFLSSTYLGELCPTGSSIYQGACYDVKLDMGALPAGDYQLAISAYFNLSFAENLGSGTLADGFTGLGNLYPGEDLHYAFDIVYGPATGDPAVIPEPSTWMLGAGGLALLQVLRARRTRQARPI